MSDPLPQVRVGAQAASQVDVCVRVRSLQTEQLRRGEAIWLKNPRNYHFSAIMPRGYSPPALDVSSLQIDTWAAASAYNAQRVAAQEAATAMMAMVG